MSNTLSFKCYLEGDGGVKEIRRFNLDSDVVGNFTYLQEKIRSIYPGLLREIFSIQYIDDEQDHVTISSDEELVSALMYVKRQPSEPFRLTVKLQGAQSKPEPPHLPQNLGNCQGNIHIGIHCDGCQGPIRGFRYKCFQCFDFDLCGKCEAAGLHPGHTMLRVTGVLPPAFAGMKHLLVDNREIPQGRKFKHLGRSFCGVGPRHGHWNAWCPSGVDIDPTTAETDDTKKDEQQERKPAECPFKLNVDQAKKAAEMFREDASSEFLMRLGNTIGTVLSQFGVGTQVDVHGPGGACPRDAKTEKPQEAPKADLPPKEHVIPVVVEKEEKQEEKQQIAKEHVIQIEKETEDNNKAEPSPYHDAIQALQAVQIADKVHEMVAAFAHESNEEATRASQDKQRSLSPHSDGWTLVDGENKPDAMTELGARPKTPPQKAPPAPLHPDPLVASALETMLGMGFTNEGGWLAQLLEVKRGDIGKALDVLQSRYQQP